MQFEVEQKFRVDDTVELERRLAALQPTRGESVNQVDRYFGHPCRDFSRTDEALRLRRVGSANYITYKGPKVDATTKTRREIEFELPRGDSGEAQAVALLVALSFVEVATVSKQRVPWNVCWEDRQVEVALDQVDGLGSFVELEVMARLDELDHARNSLAALAGRLGLANSERRSYLELLLEART